MADTRSDTRSSSGSAPGKLAGSFTWRIRKPIHAAMALAMLAGLLVAFAPFQLASQRLSAFCEALAPGTALVEVRGKALASGYRITPLADGLVLVVDPPSEGRRTCALRFDANGRLAAK